MKRPLLACLLGCWTSFVGLAASTSARAEPPAAPVRDVLAAEAAFAEARALVQQGRWGEACPKFETSLALDPAAGTVINLAECYAQTGRTASAWLRYREAAALSRDAGQTARENVARERARALEPSLCRLVIRPLGRGALTVKRDGVESAPGVPVPVDPGKHAIVAEFPRRPSATFRTEVTVRAPVSGPCEDVTVDVPEPIGAEEAPSVPAKEPDRLSSSSSSSGGWRAQHTLALVAGGLSIAGLAVGTVFGLDASSKQNESEGLCTPQCNDRGRSLREDAGTRADIATVSFVTAGVFLVTAVVLWVTAPSPTGR